MSTAEPPATALPHRPYETRRARLSLESLGIHIPGSNSASRSHRSPPTNSSTDSPPTKRVKRSHTTNSISSTLSSSPRPRLSSNAAERQRAVGASGENTPPPSPGLRPTKLDTEGISDDIVVAVLKQLESTGNRPHLIKEFATIFSTTLPVVESSANPTAIISSRLTTYLKRQWTALAPCPLAKEQVAVHPRRVYYFLTTYPRQEIPEFASTLAANKRVITPSASSAEDEDEEVEERLREILSPSPELDLSTSGLDLSTAPPESGSSFPDFIIHEEQATIFDPSQVRRAASPPMEHDEREFTQTFNTMQQRKQSEQAERQRSESAAASPASRSPEPLESDEAHDLPTFVDESAESAAIRNHEAATALFGQSLHVLHVAAPDFSSPMLKAMTAPSLTVATTTKTPYIASGKSDSDITTGDATMLDPWSAWDDMRSPENVELAELDDLFGGF